MARLINSAIQRLLARLFFSISLHNSFFFNPTQNVCAAFYSIYSIEFYRVLPSFSARTNRTEKGKNVFDGKEFLPQFGNHFNKVRLGQVRLGQVRLGKIRLSQIRLGLVRLGEVRLGQVRLDQVWLGQVRLGQVRLVKIRLSQIRLGLVWFGQVRLGKIRLSQVRLGLVRLG